MLTFTSICPLEKNLDSSTSHGINKFFQNRIPGRTPSPSAGQYQSSHRARRSNSALISSLSFRSLFSFTLYPSRFPLIHSYTKFVLAVFPTSKNSSQFHHSAFHLSALPRPALRPSTLFASLSHPYLKA
mmetsp:Transcript_10316/g.27052  ORF Transcript_10316/g.27052 Transcript_10316/m.27052 type:complete len:129 (-) Transcript_10316:289-675(-)